MMQKLTKDKYVTTVVRSTHRDFSLLGGGDGGDGGGWLTRACILGGSWNLFCDDLVGGWASKGRDGSRHSFDTVGVVAITTYKTGKR